MRRIIVALSTCVLLSSCGPLTSSNEQVLVRLPTASLKKYSNELHAAAFNMDHKRDQNYVQGYVTRDKLANLPQDLNSQIEQLTDEGNHPPLDGYHDYEALTAALERVTRTYADLAVLNTAGQSVEGRELWYVKISDNASKEEEEPKLLYIANMHGNETAGRELMLYLIDDLMAKYAAKDAATVQLVDHAQIYIMPSMNPDGFEAGERYNANGTDLNRDFPDFSSDPELRIADRQPETQAIMKLHQENHFALAVNYHGGAVCFNLPWDTIPNDDASKKFGDDFVISRLGQNYASFNPVMHNSGEFPNGVTYGYEWYEVDGGMQDYANYYQQSTHATVELSYNKYPNADKLQGIYDENRTSMLTFLNSGLNGVHLEVTDGNDAPVTNATIGLESSGRTLTYAKSQISRLSLLGTQKVTVSAPGFATQTLAVDAIPFNGTFTKVKLNAETILAK